MPLVMVTGPYCVQRKCQFFSDVTVELVTDEASDIISVQCYLLEFSSATLLREAFAKKKIMRKPGRGQVCLNKEFHNCRLY